MPAVANTAWAALTQHSTSASFTAAAGPVLLQENFDGFTSGTILTDQVTGVSFSSTNQDLDGYAEIQAATVAGASSSPNGVTGGYIIEDPNTDQVIRMGFAEAATGVAFYVIGLTGEDEVSIRVGLADEEFEILSLTDDDEEPSTPTFFGVTSDGERIVSVRVTSAVVNVELDDLMYTDPEPPECFGNSLSSEFFTGIVGSAFDDLGIASVVLRPGSVNLLLDVDPNFVPGAETVSFFITRDDPNTPASGEAVVADLSGRTCSVGADIQTLSEGELEGEVLCQGNGVLLQVSGSTGFGNSVCSANLPDPGDLPPGYEPSPEDDPSPCRELIIESPVSDPNTEMVYKKDGTFDDRLRLLYSHADPNTGGFPPYTDITDTVEEIATVVPDPTRLKGNGSWSRVRVTCAIQSELCNGIDDDGDGEVDEGLPGEGAPAVDADGDGYELCEAPDADCNDQRAFIHPGALEICNGLDDDCDDPAAPHDERVDEGNPGGGAACVVPGEMGACAEGLTSCVNANLVCEPVVDQSLEICNGEDDDCDGSVDENRVFDGYAAPVNNDGSSIFRRKSVIPFRFKLTDCAGTTVDGTVATISVFFYSGGIVGTELETLTSAGQANTGNVYRNEGGGVYVFNLSTSSLAAGNTYLVRTTLDDGTTHDVLISIR